jgi:hypothetical protein
VRGQALEVDGLHAARGEPAEDVGLGRPGVAVEQDHLRLRTGLVEPRAHVGAVGLVAALEQRHRPADLGQHRGHGVRALAAAPAVDQRREVLGPLGQRALQVGGDVSGDMRRAEAPGEQPRLLDIDGPDLGALGVVQHRQVLGPGDMVLGELGRAAHVDDRVEALQRRRVDGVEMPDGDHTGSMAVGSPKPCYIPAGPWA